MEFVPDTWEGKFAVFSMAGLWITSGGLWWYSRVVNRKLNGWYTGNKTQMKILKHEAFQLCAGTEVLKWVVTVLTVLVTVLILIWGARGVWV